ncbi:hypothetical protein ACWELB_45445 [Streptomyces asiaticus]
MATVLLGHGSSGSFLDAGVVAGAWSVGGTVTAPFRGRLVDRHGQRWPMGFIAVLTALAVAGLVTATATTQLVLSGALAGAAFAPMTVCLDDRPWADRRKSAAVRCAPKGRGAVSKCGSAAWDQPRRRRGRSTAPRGTSRGAFSGTAHPGGRGGRRPPGGRRAGCGCR